MPDPKHDLLESLRTEAVEDFLKAVYKLQSKQNPVTTSLLAKTLGVRPPSVTEMAKKLAEHGLLHYEKYKGLMLTNPGREIALEVIRHHRLIEMYLTQALGYSWDEVHEEADRLEHVISEQFESRIAAALGHPQQDPHGDPIPGPDGSLPSQDRMALTDVSLNESHEIYRITIQTAEVLRYLDSLGLIPGAEVEVTNRDPFNGPVHVRINQTAVVISHEIASHIFLSMQTPE